MCHSLRVSELHVYHDVLKIPFFFPNWNLSKFSVLFGIDHLGVFFCLTRVVLQFISHLKKKDNRCIAITNHHSRSISPFSIVVKHTVHRKGGFSCQLKVSASVGWGVGGGGGGGLKVICFFVYLTGIEKRIHVMQLHKFPCRYSKQYKFEEAQKIVKIVLTFKIIIKKLHVCNATSFVRLI